MSGWSWLVAHERVVIVALVLAVVAYGWNKWLNYDDMRQHEKLAVITDQVKKDQQALQDANDKASADQARLQQIINTTQQQQAQLLAVIEADNVLLKQRQDAVKTMPPTQVVSEWMKLVPSLQSSDVSLSNGQFAVSDGGARATVVQLEQVPILQDELKNETQIANGKQSQLDAVNMLLGDRSHQIDVLNGTIKDKDTQCDQRVSTVKADARKSKRSWFLTGLAAGAALAAEIALHL